MIRKKNANGQPREAVYMTDVSGCSGIFIHLGKPPDQNGSDGCVILHENKIIDVYVKIKASQSAIIGCALFTQRKGSQADCLWALTKLLQYVSSWLGGVLNTSI